MLSNPTALANSRHEVLSVGEVQDLSRGATHFETHLIAGENVVRPFGFDSAQVPHSSSSKLKLLSKFEGQLFYGAADGSTFACEN